MAVSSFHASFIPSFTDQLTGLQTFIGLVIGRRTSLARPSPIPEFGHDQIVRPFEIEDAEYELEKRCNDFDIRVVPNILGMAPPSTDHVYQKYGIHDASDADPCNVKAYRYEFDAEGYEAEIDDPWRESLLVEYAPCDEEPRVDFDAHANAQAESELVNAVRDEDVQERHDVVLDDRGGTFDALGNGQYPCQIEHEVEDRRVEEHVEPRSSPGF
mmetsp:Transcript_27485/g.77061  ORF Transcript_27485/g.77061 Transcript_27485/m.77061 type:complete len:214 (-) Transcript_27485:603-1244(-)